MDMDSILQRVVQDNTVPLNVIGVRCAWCDRRVVIFNDRLVLSPPKGWFRTEADQWICPDHEDDEAVPSEAEYFAVIEVPHAS